MRDSIDSFIEVLKWPVALVMVILFMPAFITMMDFLYVHLTLRNALMFGMPFIAVCAIYISIAHNTSSFLSVFEHELTHLVFGILTLHRPKSLNVQSHASGQVSFAGKGNWLIALAPYFFPLFPFLIILSSLVYMWMDQPLPMMFLPILGTVTGYHLCTNIESFHAGQTDFKVAGYTFSVLFLPTANLLSYGFLFAYASLGWSGVPIFYQMLYANTINSIQNVVQSFF